MDDNDCIMYECCFCEGEHCDGCTAYVRCSCDLGEQIRNAYSHDLEAAINPVRESWAERMHIPDDWRAR
jgi:hypothetical protein